MTSRLAAASDYAEAIQALLGPDAEGFSLNVIVRLMEKWGQETERRSRRDLSAEEAIYVRAVGIRVNVRLDDEGNKKRCLHIFMGATAEGRKERIAFLDGVRESKKSWQELLLDIKELGLSKPVKPAVDNGALWLLGRSPRGISLDQDAASRRIGMPSWPPATSRLGTWATYGRPTPSRAPSRRSASGMAARKAAARGRPA